MMYYYEELENGDLGRYTNNAKLAQKYNWTGQTDAEPVMYNGKLYLQADFKAYKQTQEYKASQQPIEQPHEPVEQSILALAEAVAAQEVRLSALEGGEKA